MEGRLGSLMLRYKRECEMIPLGFSWSWIGGLTVNYRTKNRRLYFRIRFYVKDWHGKYRMAPGFWAEIIYRESNSCRGVYWNPGWRWPSSEGL
jgi:hypothetical protein